MTARLDTPEQAAAWLRKHVRGSLLTDSRKLSAGDGFIAWPGAATDGRSFVAGALAAGVSACLVEDDGASSFDFQDDRVASYAGLKAASGPITAVYFKLPSQKLDIVAVTGTNGKTSTTWFLAQALGKLGRRCGVVGTLGIGEPGAMVSTGLTTPDPVLLQSQLRRFVDEGFAACALEASSIGIVERRLDAMIFDVAVFLNFTQDHLDFHGSMQAYWEAKKSLFKWPRLKAAVINIDDPKGVELSAALIDSGLDVWTFSCEPLPAMARLQARGLTYGDGTLSFDIVEGTQVQHIETSMVGKFNVSNLLAAVASMRAMNLPLQDIIAACCYLEPVPGRMDALALTELPMVVVDYAHTPDALEKVLTALRPVAQSRGGQLWCVFGCGGDRDRNKRPLMAAMAEKFADKIVVTSDNPRTEDSLAIIGEVLAGLNRRDAAQIEANRALAISSTLNRAMPHDVVLLAGKGHEQFQEINGIKLPFSDMAHAQAALTARANPAQMTRPA